jgi:hypothetical protein
MDFNIDKEIKYIDELTEKTRSQYLKYITDGKNIHKIYNIIHGIKGYYFNAKWFYENNNLAESIECIDNSKKCLNDLIEFVGRNITIE